MTCCGLISTQPDSTLPIEMKQSGDLVVDIHSILPFELAYLVECLVSAQKLTMYNLTHEWVAFLNDLDVGVAKNVLMNMMTAKSLIEDPLAYTQEMLPMLGNGLINLEGSLIQHVWIYRAYISPSKLHLLPPSLEPSNRVLRHFHQYQQHFIQVTFSEEHFEKIGASCQLNQAIFDSFEEILTEGFHIGKRHYRFLAFSATQLREHSCWFFAGTSDGIDVDFIRKWMGDFSDIGNVAKRAACMGLCFSNTQGVKTLTKEQVKEVPDITRNGHLHSNGVGQIAMSLAAEISSRYHQKITPGAFQFRFGGYKGVLSVVPDDKMDGTLVHLRPSQRRFSSESCDLEIVRAAEFVPAYLNRQVIALLSTMRVSDDVFVHLQAEHLRLTDEIMSSQDLALEFLALHYRSSWIGDALGDMIAAGFLRSGDSFAKSLLGLLRNQALRDVQERARVPIQKGAHLIGVIDSTDSLKENQIFVRYTDPRHPTTVKSYVGPALVIRNPYIHPGDMHMVEAVDCPELHALVNCVAFSTRGTRGLASKCNGGDMDGDTYMVIWDKRLFPLYKLPPLSYSKHEDESAQPVTIRDTVDFFINYMKSNNLAQIANAHLAWADQSEESALSPKCIVLSKLHAKAADFVKSGIPAVLQPSLIPKHWPDYMNKLPRKSYPSTHALGRMYRSDALNRQLSEYSANSLSEVHFDERMIVLGYEEYLVEARQLKHEYDRTISDIMRQHEIQTEAELVSGCVQRFSFVVSRTKERYLLKETLSNIIQAVWRIFRQRFNDNSPAVEAVDEDVEMLNRRKASAWYYVTCHPTEILLQKNQQLYSDHPNQAVHPVYLSFPWIVHDILVLILRDATL
ncbi:RdRP-domain-containing protein [Basidiobolus meristosporus CBS 931.73]|uniref:RNA-dependent RNA polymerase n=1 Tax=Basidiobolus meristosporus CBS 931.73 TaxID=1314790 RepID=A0A1Y1VRG4_9FUNG|nr:RdRP-domain-containing protein [Basidiobolus meristosporus CBS 931.73]|eukprot:ORX63616.1 RdRP-domain-containing protein [Basidiobolus meristosporus CBS 931.73]